MGFKVTRLSFLAVAAVLSGLLVSTQLGSPDQDAEFIRRWFPGWLPNFTASPSSSDRGAELVDGEPARAADNKQNRTIVIARGYAEHVSTLKTLVQSLSPGQGRSSPSSLCQFFMIETSLCQPHHRDVQVTILVLPNEAKDLSLFRAVAADLRSRAFDVWVPTFLTSELYSRARVDLTKCECPLDGPSKKFNQGMCKQPYDCNSDRFESLRTQERPPSWYSDLYEAVCFQENEAYYWLVDRVIDHVIDQWSDASHDSKTALLITNGRDVYSTAFLPKLMSVPEPIALSDFIDLQDGIGACKSKDLKWIGRPGFGYYRYDENFTTTDTLSNSRADLGGFIVDLNVLRDLNVRILTSVPEFTDDTLRVAKMRGYHEAGLWFLHNLVNKQLLNYGFVHECLYTRL